MIVYMCLIYVGEKKTATHTRTHTHTLKSGTVVSEVLLGDTSDTSLLLKLTAFAMFSDKSLRTFLMMFDFYVNPVVYVFFKLTDNSHFSMCSIWVSFISKNFFALFSFVKHGTFIRRLSCWTSQNNIQVLVYSVVNCLR